LLLNGLVFYFCFILAEYWRVKGIRRDYYYEILDGVATETLRDFKKLFNKNRGSWKKAKGLYYDFDN
jgi:hypothetical protein